MSGSTGLVTPTDPDRPGPEAAGAAASVEPWPELEPSTLRVVREIVRRGTVSRADLARSTGLSTGSLTRLTKPLLSHRVVLEGRAPAGGTGRPALPLAINPDRGRFLGLELTDAACYAVLTDLTGRALQHRRIAVVDLEPTAVIDRLAGLVETFGPELTAIGVALGAHVADARHVQTAVYLGWRDVDLGGELSRLTGRPVVVGNDVHALAQATHLFGVGRGTTSSAVVTVGVGVGSGAVVADRLLLGHLGTAGSIGHLGLDGGTARCLEADHVGCASAELSTTAVERAASRALGRPVDLAGLLALLDAGDPTATAVASRAAGLLGELAGSVAAVVGPEVLLLSGDGIGIAQRLGEQVVAGMARVLPGAAGPRLVVDDAFSFHTWAHGAAATAVLHTLTGDG